MKKIITGLFLFLAYSGFCQSSDSATIRTTASIVSPIKISKTVDLNFGSIIGGYNPGSLILNTDGSRTANGVEISNAVPGEVSPAEAIVTHSNNNYSITLPSTFSLFNEVNPAQILIIDQFTVTPTPSGEGNGIDVLKIGATLNLEANQIPGNYSNPQGFNVTVSYN